MIRSELAAIIASRNVHLYHRDVEAVVDAILDAIAEALSNGDRVELRGFGTFSVRNRPSHSGRDPRNGEAIFVKEKWAPHFKAGKEIQALLNFQERNNQPLRQGARNARVYDRDLPSYACVVEIRGNTI
jgi:integration host factor subunit beta